MKKTKFNILLGLAVCAIILSTAVIAKQQVERPYKHHGTQILILDFSKASGSVVPWEIEWQSGQATHLGLYTSSGTGEVDLDTDESIGSGYAIAANGDRVNWEVAGGIITFTGGTGRFEEATGSFTESSVTESAGPDPDFPWLYRMTRSLSGSGTISY